MKNKLFILTFILIFGLTGSVFAQKNVSLQTIGGETVSVSDQKGKVVVLAIGASWLPLSKQQASISNKLKQKYSSNDFVIYWVTTESSNAKSKNYASDDTIKSFATKNKLSATILRDPDGTATLKNYGVDQLPSFVILDKDGKQSGSSFGGLDPDNETDFYNQVVGAIDKVL